MTDNSIKSPLVVIQRNPKSGSGRGRKELPALCHALRGMNFRVRMFHDRTRLDAFVNGCDAMNIRCLVAAGGDGTVADLASRHPQLALAILPLGTENLLARYFNYPRAGAALAEVIATGTPRTFDSAMANGRRFLIMLSSGVDADVVHAIHASRTGHILRIGYLRPTLRAFLQSRPGLLLAVSTDGAQEVRGSHIVISNGPIYGFDLPFNLDARMDDGLLNVRAFTGTTRWQVFWHAVRLKLGLPLRPHEVQRFRASSVRLESVASSATSKSQMDGDPGPELPVTIEVQPASLKLWMTADMFRQ